MFDVNFFKNQTAGPFRGQSIGKNGKLLHQNKHDIHEDWAVGVVAGYFQITEMFRTLCLSDAIPDSTSQQTQINFIKLCNLSCKLASYCCTPEQFSPVPNKITICKWFSICLSKTGSYGHCAGFNSKGGVQTTILYSKEHFNIKVVKVEQWAAFERKGMFQT